MKNDQRESGNRRLRSALAFGIGILAISAFSATLSGCASQSQAVRTQVVPYSTEQIEARDGAKQARYRIRTGDIMKIVFKYETGLNQSQVLVLPDGYISLPGIGSVRAAGRTMPELDSHLNELYGREYRNPDLDLVMVEISDPEIYVMGNVSRPGLYKLPSQGLGVMQAVAVAGGFADGAEKTNTVVMRASEEGFVVRTYDLGHIEEGGIMDLTYFDLQPYDIVYVPQSKLGDLTYLTGSIFGSAKEMSNFFWDIYALTNIDKIDRLVR